jgi:hypothetical protein
MVKLNYRSNNSGGSWWLSDEDWLKLEQAGWTVAWKRLEEPGIFRCDADGRWLGALATEASKDVETPDQGIEEFARLTGQDPWAEGCSCCGEPHNFSFEDQHGKTRRPRVNRSTDFQGWD